MPERSMDDGEQRRSGGAGCSREGQLLHRGTHQPCEEVERFAASARTSPLTPIAGTSSMSVPIYTSPGRDGFGPKLPLSYDSGAGNGPFAAAGALVVCYAAQVEAEGQRWPLDLDTGLRLPLAFSLVLSLEPMSDLVRLEHSISYYQVPILHYEPQITILIFEESSLTSLRLDSGNAYSSRPSSPP
jgi:Salmonella virulence plasmid 65kDa B protein